MPTKDLEDYRRFTKPAELHKAVNTLRGLVAGINSDMEIGSAEVTELVHWCEVHAELRDRHPFSEILPVVERAMEDGVVTEEESKDILWLCNNFADNNAYYNMVTSSIQFLAGMLHGLLADGELSDQEIMTLKAWIDANEFLAGTYPFDEINSLLHVVLEDKKITQQEREALMALFGDVIDFTTSYNLSEKEFPNSGKPTALAASVLSALRSPSRISPSALPENSTGQNAPRLRTPLSSWAERCVLLYPPRPTILWLVMPEIPAGLMPAMGVRSSRQSTSAKRVPGS